VKEFAAKKKVSVQTVYSWIRRGITDKHQFKVEKIGSVTLIKPH